MPHGELPARQQVGHVPFWARPRAFPPAISTRLSFLAAAFLHAPRAGTQVGGRQQRLRSQTCHLGPFPVGAQPGSWTFASQTQARMLSAASRRHVGTQLFLLSHLGSLSPAAWAIDGVARCQHVDGWAGAGGRACGGGSSKHFFLFLKIFKNYLL